MKKKVLILTLNDYILYQPSILNLYDFMSPHFDVTIVSFYPDSRNRKIDTSRNIIYIKTGFFLNQIYQKTDFILSKLTDIYKKISPKTEYHYKYYNKFLPDRLKSEIRKKKLSADIIIAVDFPALKVAQEIYGSVHFISLEIENNTNPIHAQIDRGQVKSVFIQSKERYDYLFPEMNIPVFLVQNAPVFRETDITNYDRKDFIWSGAMDRRMSIFDCLNFFEAYPEYRLVLKGDATAKMLRRIRKRYAHLLEKGVIVIDQQYLPGSTFLDYLSHYRLGFVFYSWDIVASTFNYATAPSGKLFMNLAAGIPVVASNIPGFQLIKDFNAGVLVDDYAPSTIAAAVQKIESDYGSYQQGCYNAARFFSFDKRVEPYIDYLIKKG